MYKIITLTGNPGSGKKKVAEILIEKTGWEKINTGLMNREMALKLQVDFNLFNKYKQTHPEIDQEIDKEIKNIGETRENIIVDSRIGWYLIPKSLKVFLGTPIKVSAERIFNDHTRTSEKFASLEEAEKAIEKRRNDEIELFMKLYSIDLADMSNFDLVIDTHDKTPGEVADLIIKQLQGNSKQ